MRKIFLMLAAIFIFTASTANAAKVSLYDDGAENMFKEIAAEIESDASFPYAVKNFRFSKALDADDKKGLNLPNKNFQTYICDIFLKDSASPNGGIGFIFDDSNKVFSVLVSAFINDNMDESRQDELFKMLIISTALTLNSILEEDELNKLMDDIMQNIDKGEWGIWHGKKYVNCIVGKGDNMIIFIIDATDKK